jgi:hypothetical protein
MPWGSYIMAHAMANTMANVPAKLAQLNREMDRYKLDILGVSEVRWN